MPREQLVDEVLETVSIVIVVASIPFTLGALVLVGGKIYSVIR